MKTFKIMNGVEVECEFKKTRNGFNHVAVLHIDGKEVDRRRVSYLNRTWERYEFQTVLRELIEKTKTLTKGEKDQAMSFIKNYQEANPFGAILAITKVGDVLCNTQKEKNDWKVRMMKAGLGDAVDFPEDWDTLSEDEKEKRLGGALGALAEK